MNAKNLKKMGFGFTLIELLVALFVFSLISVFSFRAVNALTKAGEQVSAEQAALSELQKALLIWERDMRKIVPHSVVEQDPADGWQDDDKGETVVRFAINTEVGGLQVGGIQQISYVLKDHVLSRIGIPPHRADTPEEEVPKGVALLGHVSSATVEWLPGIVDSSNSGGEDGGFSPMGVILTLAHNELGDVRRVSSLVSLSGELVKVMDGLNTLDRGGSGETTTGLAPAGVAPPPKINPEDLPPVVKTFEW